MPHEDRPRFLARKAAASSSLALVALTWSATTVSRGGTDGGFGKPRTAGLGDAAGFNLSITLDALYAPTRIAPYLDDRPAYETPRFLGRFGVDIGYGI